MRKNMTNKLGKPQETDAWDYVVTSTIGAGCVLYIIGNIILFIHRKYKPIQARGVWLTLLSSLGGLIWVTATIIVLRHYVRPKNTLLAKCSLWTFWLWGCFGFALWLNCLTVRMLQLYLVFIWKMRVPKPDPLKLTVVPLLGLLSPVIVISICASAKGAVKYNLERGDCYFEKKGFAYATLGLLPTYFILFLLLAFQLRNIMAQWNEFRQIRIGGIMSFFLFLLSMVTLQSRAYYRVAGRCFLTSAVSGAVFYYFWARNWEVLYNVLFNKEKYMRRFGDELNRFHGRQGSSHFELNPMEKLVMQTKEEAREYQHRLEELQLEVTNLTQLNAQLHREVSGGISVD